MRLRIIEKRQRWQRTLGDPVLGKHGDRRLFLLVNPGAGLGLVDLGFDTKRRFVVQTLPQARDGLLALPTRLHPLRQVNRCPSPIDQPVGTVTSPLPDLIHDGEPGNIKGP